MILSTWKITFDPDGPQEAVLLDYGDRMLDEVRNSLQAQIQSGAALFATWGYNDPLGGTQRSIEWSRVQTYQTLAAMRQAQMLHGDLLPWNLSGTLRVENETGFGCDFPGAVIASSGPVCGPSPGWRLTWSFRAAAGRGRAYSGVTQSAGIPVDWWTDNFEDQDFKFNGN
jgi:hypothetical protein